MKPTPRKRPRRLDPPPPTTFRMTTPAQMVAAIPLQMGYTPTESIVVQCCHEPRGRVGLTMRIDLPPAEHEEVQADWIIAKVRSEEATRVVLLVYTDEPDGPMARARSAFMHRITDALSDIVITEALLVRDGRFWSYVCEGPCCPAEGRPVDEAEDSMAVQQIRLERQVNGRGMVGTREDLEKQLAGPGFLEEQVALQRCEVMLELLGSTIIEAGRREARKQSLQMWRRAIDEAADPRWELPPMEAAALAVSLSDVLVRDAIAATEEADAQAVRRLLELLVQRTPSPYDAPVCTLYAWLVYLDGAGTVVSILLERALATDPDYSMAHILTTALMGSMPPEQLREITARTRQALEDVA